MRCSLSLWLFVVLSDGLYITHPGGDMMIKERKREANMSAAAAASPTFLNLLIEFPLPSSFSGNESRVSI